MKKIKFSINILCIWVPSMFKGKTERCTVRKMNPKVNHMYIQFQGTRFVDSSRRHFFLFIHCCLKFAHPKVHSYVQMPFANHIVCSLTITVLIFCQIGLTNSVESGRNRMNQSTKGHWLHRPKSMHVARHLMSSCFNAKCIVSDSLEIP